MNKKNSNTANPSRPSQHECGDFGERFVAYHLPTAWVIHEYKGSEDYGIDFHVEVFQDGNPTGLEFGVQVKTENKKLSAVSQFSVSKNNLTYIAAKPYPTMAVIVSRPDKDAIYIWFPDVLSDKAILQTLSDQNTPMKVRIPIQSPEPFVDGVNRIINFLRDHNAHVDQWLATTAHTHLMVNLYLDIHASLDVLIECDALLHQKGRPDDEISHKLTFSFITTVSAYGCLYGLTQPDKLPIFGPLVPTILGLRNSFRKILSEMMTEDVLNDYEKGDDSDSDFFIAPAKYSAFPPAIPHLLKVIRDILRTTSRFMAPSRNFSQDMSGMANMIIDYKTRKNRRAGKINSADVKSRAAD